jgi:thiamine pyrophosphokinase
LIGDLDSLPKATLTRVKKANPDLEMIVVQAEKDQTDFELALEYITTKYTNYGRIEVLGSLGGRWDMTISNLLLPFSESYLTPIRQSRLLKGQTLAPPVVIFRDAHWDIFLLSGPGWVVLNPLPIYRRVSLIPISPRVSKVRLSGDFKYPLNDEDLVLGLTRGVSNEMGPAGGNVFVGSGLLIVTVSPLLGPALSFKPAPSQALGWKAIPKKQKSSPASKPSTKATNKKADQKALLSSDQDPDQKPTKPTTKKTK